MRAWSVALTLGVMACTATPPPAVAPQPATAAAAEVPLSIRWFRGSAEQRAGYLQAYDWATERLRAMVPGAGGAWAVILDADETIIDNSTYQLRQARLGREFDAESWNAWARERAAAALPGAVAFTQEVRRMGGRVVIVTNRDAVVCDDTRANLQALEVPMDLVLCRGDTSDKNPRFRAVQEGTAEAGTPPLRVLMWVGDNIQDFPGMSQAAARTAPEIAFDRFGRDWILLPNPMYGSWERNPVQ